VLVFAALFGATGLGIFLGRRARHLADTLEEAFRILQGALLGLVGLLLAFGLSLAVSRYEDRRANIVTEANAGNRVPTAVLVLELIGAAIALGLLAAYLTIAGRGVPAVVLASGFVAFLVLVTADLDRPTRGLIRGPDAALKDQLKSMNEPAAAPAPRSL
jgi:hypothetical protein